MSKKSNSWRGWVNPNLSPESGSRPKSRYRPFKYRVSKNGPDYDDYFKTWAWKEKRDLIMRYFCHRCQKDPREFAHHVHHLTYSRFKNELPMDLMPLSKSAHKLIHLTIGQDALEKTINALGDDLVCEYRKSLQSVTWEQIRDQVKANLPRPITLQQAWRAPKPIQHWISRSKTKSD